MNKTELTPQALAQMIDQTLLKPYATLPQFESFCKEAHEYVAAKSSPLPVKALHKALFFSLSCI